MWSKFKICLLTNSYIQKLTSSFLNAITKTPAVMRSKKATTCKHAYWRKRVHRALLSLHFTKNSCYWKHYNNYVLISDDTYTLHKNVQILYIIIYLWRKYYTHEPHGYLLLNKQKSMYNILTPSIIAVYNFL